MDKAHKILLNVLTNMEVELIPHIVAWVLGSESWELYNKEKRRINQIRIFLFFLDTEKTLGKFPQHIKRFC